MSDQKITYVVVLTEEERRALLKYNDDVMKDSFDSEDDYKKYDSALQRVWNAKGILPVRERTLGYVLND